MRFSVFSAATALCCATMLLSACGYKGPLVMPPRNLPAAPAKSAPQPAADHSSAAVAQPAAPSAAEPAPAK